MGREFIAQVPGVTMSSLNNEDIAELLNWMLIANSKDQLPEKFTLYTAAEISELRKTPNRDPLKDRVRILDIVAKDYAPLAIELEADGYAY